MSGREEVSSAPPAAASILIDALTRDLGDMTAVDAIARASFCELNFSSEKEMERPWARLWVAREQTEGAAPVAFLITWHVADELHILNVATLPTARRQGIGTALMHTALRYATEQRVRLVLLEVRRSNEEARRLYQRLGFTETGIRAGYYADNGEDAIEMMLTLDSETGAIGAGDSEIRIDV